MVSRELPCICSQIGNSIFWYWWLNNIVAVSGMVNLIRLWYSLMYSDFNDIWFPAFYNIGCELPRSPAVNGLIK